MRPAFSDTRLLATLGVEVLLGAVLIWWLRRRGWQPAVSVGRPAFADVPRGTVLWIATFAVTTLLSLAVSTSILPVGVIWTSYFLWRRRLWPVVVAHIINNAIGLSAFLIGGD